MFKSMFAVGSALILSAAVANASDMPSNKTSKASAPVAAKSSNWTGAYMGVVGGYDWGTADIAPSFLFDDEAYKMNLDGMVVGAQIGYDVELPNNVVLGLVADYSWSDLKDSVCVESGGCHNAADDSYASGKIGQLGTLRARVGYAVDNVLIYGTGGLAYADTSAAVSYLDSDPDSGVTASAKVWGWTVGGGAEMMIASNLSFGVEYLYADFGKVAYEFSNSDIPGNIPVVVDVSQSIVRGSLNYRF